MTFRTVTAGILSATERRDLESAVLSGRAASEGAAIHEVNRLGVAADKAPAYLSEVERALRRELRAKARQLGDTVADGQHLPLLVAEIAYEQWHRLLFAKFLEANGLLIHPGFGMAVTLEECEELASGMEDVDAWSLAARFASETLPGVFRLTDPCVRIRLAPEDLQRLERIIAGLRSDIFRCEDALGWVYQFWQTTRKKQVNDAGNKVGGADISPVTQLFTENYMVRFLLENSLGAWWAGKHPESLLVAEWDYLRLADDGTPAAGGFAQWPSSAAEITVMDPCCGSGHFLIAAFGMLWRMRAEEEGLTPAEAQDAVLRENLFGLELDPRCAQLATFNLVLESWKQGGYRELPAPSVACSGIPVRAAGSEWEDLAGDDHALRGSLTRLHSQFRNADTLGSLINPAVDPDQGALLGRNGMLGGADLGHISEALRQAVAAEQSTDTVFGDTVNDVAKAAQYLSKQYSLVVTNPPFLLATKQSALLRDHLSHYHPNSSTDIATAFVERSLDMAHSVAMVLPQNWLFLKSYKDMREDILGRKTFHFVSWLGEKAFRSDQAAGAIPALVSISNAAPRGGGPFLLDVATSPSLEAKALALSNAEIVHREQSVTLSSPDARILIDAVDHTSIRIRDLADVFAGLQTGDTNRYVRAFWEFPSLPAAWDLYQGAPVAAAPYAARTMVVKWEDGEGSMSEEPGAYIRGKAAWGRNGVMVRLYRNLVSTLYSGDLFDQAGVAVVPKNPTDLGLLWAYLQSDEFQREVRRLDRKTNVTPASVGNAAIDVQRWRSVAAESGALPQPASNDPAQWLFSGAPVGSAEPLQAAVARLLGYEWPQQAEDALGEFADTDGIVCIPAVAGERNAADRLLEILAKAYGENWSSATRDELLTEAGGKAGDVEGWLRDKFFAQHVGVFHNRPFLWQIWDGQKDGFSALLNYHSLTKAKLEKLTYSILGAWISRLRDDAAGGQIGADVRLRAAEALQQKLRLVLEGEAPHDIYVRWKELVDQPIGWDPDLDDGIRLNIRPFVTAGILRSKVNVKWDKDRGKNADGTDRINDLHYTLQEKQDARG